MFAHNIFNFLSYLVKDGQIVLDWEDEVIVQPLLLLKENPSQRHQGSNGFSLKE